MGNRSQNRSCGCSILNAFADAINNLFDPTPYCGTCGCNQGCGCGQTAFTNGFVSGVNAANDVANAGGCGCNGNGNSGCGCNGNPIQPIAGGTNVNGGCGCNGNGNGNGNSGCGCNGWYDVYYARQYALGPFGGNGCGCGVQGIAF